MGSEKMKKNYTFNQTINIISKILIAFILVYLLYYIGEKTNSFTYDYFIFPILAVLIIFICGVKVGRTLESMKTKQSKSINVKNNKNTEFIVPERVAIVTNKKVVSEKDFEEKVHKKIYDYDDVNNKEKVEKSE